MTTIGIDVSKRKLDVSILLESSKISYKVFENNFQGFKNFHSWLIRLGISQAHVCLEATGCYGEELSLFLYEHGYRVSVVNPARIKAYARSEGCRVKTDKVDSAVIARFCKAQCPALWVPPSLSEQTLKDLYRCRQNLLMDKNRITNRLESLMRKQDSIKIWKNLLSSIEAQIKEVDQQVTNLLQNDQGLRKQVDLLKTIPGVSDQTAIAVLSELPPIKSFNNAKEVAAFAGLTPFEKQSGSSLKSKGRLSKTGNSKLRKALYMPTIVAKRYNPLLQSFCQRLSSKGKPTMVVIAAGMRKLLHIIFGVLKTQNPFTFSEKGA